MEVARRSQVRLDESEWRELIEAWQKSGETIKAFCQARGVQRATFHRWHQRLNEPTPREEFVPVLRQVTSPPSSSWSLEIALPNGTTLRFQG